MIVARFPGPDEVRDAMRRLRDAGVPAETRTPMAMPEDVDGGSRLPLLVLATGLLAAAGRSACSGTPTPPAIR